MAISIKTQYKKPTTGADTDITVSASLVSFRPQDAVRDELGVTYYIKVSATGASDWYRAVDGMLSDGMRGYQWGVDGGSSFTDSYSDGLDDFAVEGVLTQLEKPACPTAVDATAEGSGNVTVTFVASVSHEDVVAGYYFWRSANGETWTRIQALGSGVAKASLDDYTIAGVAKKGATFAAGTTGALYFAVTTAGSVVATSEFSESVRCAMTTTVTIT